MRARLPLLAGAVLGVGALSSLAPEVRAVASSRWAKVDYEQLERDWEADDDAAELKSSGEHLYEEVQREQAAGALGATMMFVTLRGDRTAAATAAFGEEVTKLALTGGIRVTVYKLEAGKVVVTVVKGWEAGPLFELLQGLPQVEVVEWADKDSASKQPPPPQRQAPSAPRGKRRRRRRRRRQSQAPENKDEL